MYLRYQVPNLRCQAQSPSLIPDWLQEKTTYFVLKFPEEQLSISRGTRSICMNIWIPLYIADGCRVQLENSDVTPFDSGHLQIEILNKQFFRHAHTGIQYR